MRLAAATALLALPTAAGAQADRPAGDAPATPTDSTVRRCPPPADAAPRPDSGAVGAADSAAACPRPLRRAYALPVLGYAPETGVLYGVGAVRVTRRPGAPRQERPTTLGAQVIGTQRSQLVASVTGDWWTAANAARYRLDASYSRFPFRFYGIGRAASDTGEQYTPATLSARVSGQWRVAPGLYLGGSYDVAEVTMRRVAAGGLLAADTVAGARGGRRAAVGALASVDTRDNVYFARRGAFVTLTGRVAGDATGSSFAFRRVRLDARRYLPLGARAALALQGVADAAWGDVPFDALPMLGGAELLRGNMEGRFRDRAAAAVQAELRSGPVLWRRVGFAAFAGAGDVAPGLDRLRAGSLVPSAGLGVRWMLDTAERINLRVDLAAGRGQFSPYVGFSEAF